MKMINILLLTIFLTGCSSLIPRINFDTPNTTPKSIEKSKGKDVCDGEAKLNENGDIIYCSKGYYSYAENYGKQEREYTLKEKILNFFRNLTGSLFWVSIALLIFAPGFLGWLIGRIFNSAQYGVEAMIRSVNRAKRKGTDVRYEIAEERKKNPRAFIEVDKKRFILKQRGEDE